MMIDTATCSTRSKASLLFGLLFLSLFAGSGCGPDSMAYQSFQDARMVNDFRLAGKIDGATFAAYVEKFGSPNFGGDPHFDVFPGGET
ncbi:MAG: hypothetical protein QMB94_02005, partial [Phycisphaerales bacterium]